MSVESKRALLQGEREVKSGAAVRKVLLLGFHVGEAYFERYSAGDKFPQVAAYKLESRFIEALRLAGLRVDTLATIAVSTFPRIKRVWLPGKLLPGNGQGGGRVMPFVNLPVIKMLTRCVGSFYGLLRMGRRTDAICVYAAHSPNLLAAYLYSKLCKKPFFVYVPDLPSFMDVALGRGRLLKLLKKLDASLLSGLLASSNGLVVISRPMVEDYPAWRSKPYMVLEGISSSSSGPVTVAGSGRKQMIFYAGGVNRSYGIVELVEGFLRSGIDYELVLCGRGDLEGYLTDVCARHASVKYLGFVSPERVAQLQGAASLLLLTRNPAERYTRYSFPSKLIEYMSAGIPVLTTRLAGIPDEYFDYINVIEEFSIDAVARALVDFSAADKQNLYDKAARGKVWVLETKSSRAVGKQLVEFMENNK
ncbi:glycosyltransferase [Pseudomonas sp. YQ_13]|uniref:glycosyltransferase n=1 Tax=Pseudomonas sp. YQ_13 TaxID=3367235 RepID=UPI00370B448D